MLSLSSAAILEKNRLEASGSWLILLKVQFPDLTTIHLARNNEDVVWPSSGTTQTYTAFPFDFEDGREEGQGEHGTLVLKIGNVTRTIQSYLEESGNSGGVGSNVDLYIVHSDYLNLENPEVHETFIVTSSSADSMWATFDLSAPNQVYVMFPPYRYLKNFCRWSFNYPVGVGLKCGYSGTTPYTNCNKTLSDCRLRGNTRYFGAFPGIPEGATWVGGEK